MNAAEQTMYVPVVGDIDEYMPTVPALHTYVPARPVAARLVHWVSTVGLAAVGSALLVTAAALLAVIS